MSAVGHVRSVGRVSAALKKSELSNDYPGMKGCCSSGFLRRQRSIEDNPRLSNALSFHIGLQPDGIAVGRRRDGSAVGERAAVRVQSNLYMVGTAPRGDPDLDPSHRFFIQSILSEADSAMATRAWSQLRVHTVPARTVVVATFLFVRHELRPLEPELHGGPEKPALDVRPRKRESPQSGLL